MAVITALAQHRGVCARPITQRVTDSVTGEVVELAMPCGSTRASRCMACSDRARRLRMHQCREGWHLEHEPPAPERTAARGDEDDDPEGIGAEVDEMDDDEAACVGRSTRRRADVEGLPKRIMEDRTVGSAFTSNKTGQTYRPSMFLTLTLPSYGRVRAGGVPVDPSSYDYRRAALDALHFPKLMDRFWQNLRRCAGFNVQYFATIEGQLRGAPHLHAAMRGAIPRELLRQVTAATYAHVWWPTVDPDHPTYDPDAGQAPAWDGRHGCYVDPDTRDPLPGFDELRAEVTVPAHTVRFGTQLDMQGVLAGSPDAERRIGYLCKYLAKDIAGGYDDPDDESPARRRHLDRLANEVARLPCSPTCANWLRYGINPRHPREQTTPGRCPGKAHERENLGLGGRRVLVSRLWTGKTLTDHRADRATVVRQALEAAGIDPDDHQHLSATTLTDDGQPRYRWELVPVHKLTTTEYAQVIGRLITDNERWRTQLDQARDRADPNDAGGGGLIGGGGDGRPEATAA